jgi:hypothetical protein
MCPRLAAQRAPEAPGSGVSPMPFAPLPMPLPAWLGVAGNGGVPVVPAKISGAATTLQAIASPPVSGPRGAAHLASPSATTHPPEPTRQRAACGLCPRLASGEGPHAFGATLHGPRWPLAAGVRPRVTSAGWSPQDPTEAGGARGAPEGDERRCTRVARASPRRPSSPPRPAHAGAQAGRDGTPGRGRGALARAARPAALGADDGRGLAKSSSPGHGGGERHPACSGTPRPFRPG